MSHIPPNGPPPPYYGYPVPPGHPPAPGGFTYMPAPVMMPVYPPPPPHPPQHETVAPPQPTYVTNYIYQQPPPEPVQVVDSPDLIDWVPSTPTSAQSLSHRAFVAGKEGWDSSPLWVIRAHHSGQCVPGKLAVKHRSAYIPFAGKEVPVHNFEVFCAPAYMVRWLPSSNGQVPPGAIAAGNTHSGEPLYIARVRHLRSITPGKVHPSHGCSYISFEGSEIPYKSYEVLCKIESGGWDLQAR